jgi:hypothetical protein
MITIQMTMLHVLMMMTRKLLGLLKKCHEWRQMKTTMLLMMMLMISKNRSMTFVVVVSRPPLTQLLLLPIPQVTPPLPYRMTI